MPTAPKSPRKTKPKSKPPTTTKARRIGTRGPANAEALRAAAHRLVLERGEHFTTQDLVKEADVALQTFYRHYGGKDQLLLAVIGDLVTEHCEALSTRAAGLEDPVDRLRFYITETLSTLVANRAAPAGRFMTSQHWRLHSLYPEELAAANRPFADLIARELVEARNVGLLAPRSPERDAWIINQLVMAIFHYYAFANDDAAATVADDVWQFCRAALIGPVEAGATTSRVRER